MIPIPPPAVWFGGERCEIVQLERWLGSARMTDAIAQDIAQDIAEQALDDFEAAQGLSANVDLAVFAVEFWSPYAEPLAREQWAVLLSPAARWYAERVRCIDAWRFAHGRDPELQASLEEPFAAFLAEQRGADELRAQTFALLDAHAAAFAPLALEMLPR